MYYRGAVAAGTDLPGGRAGAAGGEVLTVRLTPRRVTRQLINMNEHTDVWPFKEPVDSRDVPNNNDIIKDPIVLLQIEDIQVQQNQMQCLLKESCFRAGPESYIPAEVVEAWISTFKHDNPELRRDDGTVLIQSFYGLQHLLTEHPNVEELTNFGIQYMQHDMIFFSMRQENHWYLVVINSAQQAIQILDPAPKSKIPETYINNFLRVIEQCLEYAVKEGYPNAWPYYNVATWKQNHITKIPRQKNRASSTLFLIKYIQHWTGQRMEKHFTQEDINMFRLKIGPLLMLHQMNRAGKD